jgi:hypothetical protein
MLACCGTAVSTVLPDRNMIHSSQRAHSHMCALHHAMPFARSSGSSPRVLPACLPSQPPRIRDSPPRRMPRQLSCPAPPPRAPPVAPRPAHGVRPEVRPGAGPSPCHVAGQDHGPDLGQQRWVGLGASRGRGQSRSRCLDGLGRPCKHVATIASCRRNVICYLMSQ